jgi:hypothetical protein
MRTNPSFGHRTIDRRAPAAAVVVTAVAMLGSALRADEHPTLLPLSVIVYDHAGLPPAVLDRATQVATRLFRPIGIEITWLAPDSAKLVRPTAGPEDALRVIQRAVFVRLLSRAMVDARQVGEGVLGQAVLGSQFVSVFTARVMALADRGRTNQGVLLGHVIAHEIGHLLLPQPGHSVGGLMRASFDVREADFGRLHFDTWQGQLIRERLSRVEQVAQRTTLQ